MFNKNDYSNLSVCLLKRLCRQKKVTNCSKMKKQQLIDAFNEVVAVESIQRTFRNYLYRNAVDNITLEDVKFPCFIYRVKTGQLFFYDYSSIIKYIMKSGKVIDPNTRNEYTDLELLRLDAEAKLHFPDKNFKSTYKIKKNENYAKRIRNRENDILTFQMRLEEIKAIVLTIINDNILSWNLTGPLVIDNIEYHTFNDYLKSIIRELKILYLNLKSYSEFEANCFKDSFIVEINDRSEYFLNVISHF